MREFTLDHLDESYKSVSARWPARCTDTSDLRHFGPETFRHWCRSVHWTFRCHRKNQRHFGTSAEVSWTFRQHLYFIHRSVTLIYLFKKDYFIDDLCHISVLFIYYIYKVFFVQGNQHTTELAEPLFYHGDAKANSFIEANSFFLPNCLSLMHNSLFYTYIYPSNRYVVIGFIIWKKEYNLCLQPTYVYTASHKNRSSIAIAVSWRSR